MNRTYSQPIIALQAFYPTVLKLTMFGHGDQIADPYGSGIQTYNPFTSEAQGAAHPQHQQQYQYSTQQIPDPQVRTNVGVVH